MKKEPKTDTRFIGAYAAEADVLTDPETTTNAPVEEPTLAVATSKYDYTKPIADWKPVQVEEYYEAHGLGKRQLSDLNEEELEVLSRHGQIAQTRREAAEQNGHAAEVEGIRRLVIQQVNCHALANVLSQYLRQTMQNVRNGKESDPNFEVTFSFGAHSLTLTADDIVQATVTRSNSTVDGYQNAVAALLEICKSTAHLRRKRIETPKGKNYAPFTTDLKASIFEAKLKEVYAPQQPTE